MQGNTRETRISSLPRAFPDCPSRQRVSIRKVKKSLNPPSSTSSLGKKQGDKRFKAGKGEGDAPRCFKCGSTDHSIVDCPEVSPDDRIRKGKKVKFAALGAKLSVDTQEDPSRLPCARLNDWMEVDYLLDS